MNNQQRAELAALCRSVRWDVSMASFSTFRTGGMVESMVETNDQDELAGLMRWLHQQQVPWHVIGGGSNILVTSRYHEGVYIRLRGTVDTIVVLPAPSVPDESVVTVSAGCNLAAFVSWCAGNGLTGLEFMAGIPGSVGGAIWMNAGAFGHAIGETLHTVSYIADHGEVRLATREDLILSYRSARFPGEPGENLLITEGSFLLRHADKRQLAQQCRDIMERRRQKQPAGVASAGSFFKNPEGDFAGRLIELAGLKGTTRGKAMVSPVHANFIVNTGGAEPEDILELMQEVRERVWQQSGVLLEPEVHIL